MDSIRQRYIQAERDFLHAIHMDKRLLDDFAERWETLCSDWESCAHQADCDTQELVDRIVANVEELAGDLCFVESRTLSLRDDLFGGLEDLLASLTLEDPVTHADSVPGGCMDAVEHLSPNSTTSPSQWLLRNLHNPYPLPHIQFSAGRTAGSKHFKDWFSKARQRIGWTRLLRDRFTGRRSLATDAAFRAFVRDDPANPLDADLKTAFFAIRSHAELVYGEQEAVSPSSKRLRSISPTPSLTFSSGSEDSDDEQCPTPLPEDIFKRPSKRACPDSPSRKRRRTHESLTSPELRTQPGISPADIDDLSLRPKKRRLSENASGHSRRKRPRGIEDGRSHAVADPLVGCTAPTWFDFGRSFQIPNPASTRPLDPFSFDLDFFNPPSLPSCAASSIPALSADVAVTADDLSTLFEIPQLDLLQPGLPTFDCDWTEFLNFEPDLSLFPYSPSTMPSLSSTPPLVDDAILSPSPSDGDLPNPDPFLKTLPLLNEKDDQFPTTGEPIIREPYSLLPPREDAGIPSAAALFSMY